MQPTGSQAGPCWDTRRLHDAQAVLNTFAERQVGASLGQLAGPLVSQGRYGAADPLYQRALGIRERTLGADHPDVAGTLNSIAGLRVSQGLYDDAEALHLRALRIRETAFGVDHPADGADNHGFFVVDEYECTRCQLCIDRCPTNVISIGKFEGSVTAQAMNAGLVDQAPWDVDTGARDFKNGYSYGMRW